MYLHGNSQQVVVALARVLSRKRYTCTASNAALYRFLKKKCCCRCYVSMLLQATLLLWGIVEFQLTVYQANSPTAWEFLQLCPLKLRLVCFYSSPPPRTRRRWWCGSQRSTHSNVFLLAKRCAVTTNHSNYHCDWMILCSIKSGALFTVVVCLACDLDYFIWAMFS